MKTINKDKIRAFIRRDSIYIALLLAFAFMMIFYPNEGKFKYIYHKGRPWIYETLMAPIDFPILKNQSELNKEKDIAAKKVVPYYREDVSIPETKLSELARLQVNASLNQEFENNMERSLRKIFESGIIAEDNVAGNSSYIIVQKEIRAHEQLVSELYTPGKALRFMKSELMVEYPVLNIDSLFNLLQIQDYVVPNLIYDPKTTELLHREAIDFISPTKGMIYTGQIIVSKGEIITAEIEQLLDSYKAEYELSMGYSGGLTQLILGHSIIIIAILFMIYITVFFVNSDILRQRNKFYFLLSVTLLMFIITVITKQVNSQLLFIVPYAVFALYMMAFFKAKLVFPLYMIALMPMLIICEHGVELYIINVFGGGIALLLFSFFNRGWWQFFNSFIIFIGIFLTYLSFIMLANERIETLDYKIMLHLFLNALFVVAAYPLVFLLEKIFGLVSGSTLRDLSDTNSKVLQELARKAPGTFQHSMQVANLAERAVAEIGGNARLVKVGALYHDIGKMANPQCFIENQAPGINYHEHMTTEESAKAIIKHVHDGLELAKKYNLPQVIRDFITSHHGKSQALFFYNKFLAEGGDPSHIGEFTYNGTLPATKEQVVIMMADAVEAASRTLKDYSEESISNLVDTILRKRMSDSQLINAEISIKEINIVKEVFKKQLQEIYHARIEYPDSKKQ
jgi:cyclic-di-AMP phosphodiesterase PgpH